MCARRELHLSDLLSFRNMSNMSTRVFFDEAASWPCVSGSESEDVACGRSAEMQIPRAYNKAVREGFFNVRSCGWVPVERPGLNAARKPTKLKMETDGLCMGHYTERVPLARNRSRTPWRTPIAVV